MFRQGIAGACSVSQSMSIAALYVHDTRHVLDGSAVILSKAHQALQTLEHYSNRLEQVLGSLSALGYGPLAGVTVIGMQFLDFFDFLTNSVMMPIAAIATCLLVSRVIGVDKIEQEVELDGQPFRRKRIFRFMIRWLCPVFAAVILASSVANAFGIIKM